MEMYYSWWTVIIAATRRVASWVDTVLFPIYRYRLSLRHSLLLISTLNSLDGAIPVLGEQLHTNRDTLGLGKETALDNKQSSHNLGNTVSATALQTC
ncbi:hypothetical protein G7K_1598-t1 [Saitoella complicata NRRL Y-17804]|uniref:Uncharacterized protein n=1 Tax=Saitoella complicata (strain BCRC 22490 / CBS 7301 / JCM 7358 / NBRC 10748 / NRRL Y-17804) TaxID=698492 RepID=A0A0E9NDC5_SAICN|nr:hypothetical protein G7K_1598-t1 [Saitoella complicata NRRL Y-17804]